MLTDEYNRFFFLQTRSRGENKKKTRKEQELARYPRSENRLTRASSCLSCDLASRRIIVKFLHDRSYLILPMRCVRVHVLLRIYEWIRLGGPPDTGNCYQALLSFCRSLAVHVSLARDRRPNISRELITAVTSSLPGRG